MFEDPQCFIPQEENFDHNQLQEIIQNTKINILQLVKDWISTPFLTFAANHNLVLISQQFFNQVSSPKKSPKLGNYETSERSDLEILLISIKRMVKQNNKKSLFTFL